jgi:hypothetical protein
MLINVNSASRLHREAALLSALSGGVADIGPLSFSIPAIMGEQGGDAKR